MTITNILFLILGFQIGLIVMEPTILKAGCTLRVFMLVLLESFWKP